MLSGNWKRKPYLLGKGGGSNHPDWLETTADKFLQKRN